MTLARMQYPANEKALAEELLFGTLQKGGSVLVGLDTDTDKLTFGFTAAPEPPPPPEQDPPPDEGKDEKEKELVGR